jgi:hypothetical protein
MMLCNNCNLRDVTRKGLCNTCYMRAYRRGDSLPMSEERLFPIVQANAKTIRAWMEAQLLAEGWTPPTE